MANDFFSWIKFFLAAGVVSTVLMVVTQQGMFSWMGSFAGIGISFALIISLAMYFLVGLISYPVAVFLKGAFKVEGFGLLLLAPAVALTVIVTLLIPAVLVSLLVFFGALLGLVIPLGLTYVLYSFAKWKVSVI